MRIWTRGGLRHAAAGGGRSRRRATGLALLLLSAALGGCGSGSQAVDPARSLIASDVGWIGAWAAAPYGPYPLGPISGSAATPAPVPIAFPLPSYLPNNHAVDQSFRMIVHPTIGADAVRIRLSNLMGDRPVTFDPVRVAQSLGPSGPAIVPGTDTAVRFGGQPAVTVAPGAEVVSDPVPFVYAVGDDLAISFHVVGESGALTWHAISFGPNYLGLPMAGDSTGDISGLSFPQPSVGWFFISGVDARVAHSPGSVVAIGDSITDGAYTVMNNRWTDDFAARLQALGVEMGVLNEGINSNTVTTAGSPPGDEYKGPAAVLRFGRDVLQRPGVRSVVIFEGTNDLSAGVSAEAVFAGLRDMVARAHAAGLCVVMGTIMPRGDTPAYPWTADNETQRQALNRLILAQTDLEGIADFAAAMASPVDANAPNLPYYFADLLHPNPVGTRVMADAVPLTALVPPPAGDCRR